MIIVCASAMVLFNGKSTKIYFKTKSFFNVRWLRQKRGIPIE